MVLAGPGSGKTFVITQRIKYLIEKQNVSPEKILVLTFTKEAAISMKERYVKQENVSRAVKQINVSQSVNFGTFHSIFYQILKRSANFQDKQILNESEKRKILFTILEKRFPDLNFLERNQLVIELIPVMGYYKNTCGNLEALAKIPREIREKFLEIHDEYEKIRKDAGKLDFDDMLADCRELFLVRKEIREAWQNRFEHILIDEFQDVNPAQYEVIKLLSKKPWNLFAVGDDDQSIYGFRGSDPYCMKRFREEFEAKMIVLNVNYRSNQAIIDASKRFISCNRERFEKDYFSNEKQNLGRDQVKLLGFSGKKEELEYLLQACVEFLKGHDERKLGVLFRTNRNMQRYALALKKQGLPFEMKDKIRNPYQHEICMDFYAYFCLSIGREQVSNLTRIVNKPPRYVGREAMANVFNSLKRENREKTALQLLTEFYASKDDRVTERLKALHKNLETMRNLSPYTAVQYVRKVMGYDVYISECFRNHAERKEEAMDVLEWLTEEAKEQDDLICWLDQFTAEEQSTLNNQRNCNCEDGITLMTVHGAKGLEFDQVILPDVNERNYPHGMLLDQKTLEEERRIFYVGMTRAKTNLRLLYVNHEDGNVPSRFLRELYGQKTRID